MLSLSNKFQKKTLQRGKRMTKTVKAKFTKGIFQVFGNISLVEGEEVILTINTLPKDKDETWSELANSSFTKDWDNKEDSIYDDWKEHYNVQ